MSQDSDTRLMTDDNMEGFATLTVGIIVVIVISIIVSVIIFILCCVYCFCKGRTASRGVVLRNPGQSHVSTTTTTYTFQPAAQQPWRAGPPPVGYPQYPAIPMPPPGAGPPPYQPPGPSANQYFPQQPPYPAVSYDPHQKASAPPME